MTYEMIGRLTTELHDTAEALAASTQARLLQVDTIQAQRARIAELEAENERLRRAALAIAMRPVTLTDRGTGDGYVLDDNGGMENILRALADRPVVRYADDDCDCMPTWDVQS